MNAQELKLRTKRFGLRVIELVDSLPANQTTRVIGSQLLRSGTSVGSNYRSTCRGRSKPDFISKPGIVIEEADASLYWMKLLVESKLISQERISPLMQEADELIAFSTASTKTARSSLHKKGG